MYKIVDYFISLTNDISLVKRKNTASKTCRKKKNIESAINAASVRPFTNTA